MPIMTHSSCDYQCETLRLVCMGMRVQDRCRQEILAVLESRALRQVRLLGFVTPHPCVSLHCCLLFIASSAVYLFAPCNAHVHNPMRYTRTIQKSLKQLSSQHKKEAAKRLKALDALRAVSTAAVRRQQQLVDTCPAVS